MTNGAEKLSLEIEVIPASREHEPILANLLHLYAHDFSEFHEVEIGDDGRFVYKNLPRYWSEAGRYAFLVRAGGNLAGFVLVKKGSEVSSHGAVWDMAEFFVLRAYRRRGVGTRVANEVWQRFPGTWEVRVLASNVPARDFWARAISGLKGEEIRPWRIEVGGESWDVFSFESRR